MRRLLLHTILLLLLSSIAAFAGDHKTLRLNSGQVISGEVLFENEEVVVLKSADGSRYQFLRTEIESVTDGVAQEQVEEKKEAVPERKVGLQLHLSGGAADLPGQYWCGSAEGLVAIGAKNLLGKHLFLGGAAGYKAVIHNKQLYSFIPIAVAAQIPFIDNKTAPFAGAALGYGIAASKAYKGGLYAMVDVGCRWTTRNNGFVALALNTSFQQTRLNLTETLDSNTYTNNTGRCFVTIGAKLIVEL